MLRDPEFGPICLRAFGSYAIRVQDAPLFLREIVGTDGRFTTDEITQQLRNMVVSRFTLIFSAKPDQPWIWPVTTISSASSCCSASPRNLPRLGWN